MAIGNPNFSRGSTGTSPTGELGSLFQQFGTGLQEQARQRELDAQRKAQQESDTLRANQSLQLQKDKLLSDTAYRDAQATRAEEARKANELFRNKQFDIQQAQEQRANAAYNADVLASQLLGKGPQTKQGLITDAVLQDPSIISGMEFSPTDTPEQRAAKETAQKDLSDYATKLGASPIKESQQEYLSRVAGEVGSKGFAVPKSLLTQLNTTRVSDLTANQNKRDELLKQSSKIDKSLSTLVRDASKIKDKGTGTGSSAASKKRSADNYVGLQKDLQSSIKGTDLDSKDKEIAFRNAQQLYTKLTTEDGVDPAIARSIIANSTKVDSGWFNDDIKQVAPLYNTLRESALKHQAATGGITGGSAELGAIKDQYANLLKEKASLADKGSLLSLSNNERDLRRVLQGLPRTEQSTVVPQSTTTTPNIETKTTTPRSSEVVLDSTAPRFTLPAEGATVQRAMIINDIKRLQQGNLLTRGKTDDYVKRVIDEKYGEGAFDAFNIQNR